MATTTPTPASPKLAAPPADEVEIPAPEEKPKPAPPGTMVIFGATGDLTKRKLFPALYNLAASGLLPDELAVVGMGRTEVSTEDFRAKLKDEIHQFATAKVDEELVRWLVERVYYTPGEFQDAAAFERLEQTIEKAEAERATGGSRLYYLAVPPAFFSTIVDQLGKAGMVREENGHFRRVIIEKPFGRDPE